MKITRSRTFLQVRVGRNAIAEVVLNVRLADLEWINGDNNHHETKQQQQRRQNVNDNDNDDDDISTETTTTTTTTVLQEFFHLLQTSILPRIMGNEIEECNYPNNGRQKPPPLGPGGIPVNVVAEKNKKKKPISNNNNNKKQQAGKYKKGGAAAAATTAAAATAAGGTKRKRGGKNNKLEPPSIHNHCDEDRTTNIERDVFYAFGESIQVAYRWEEIQEQKHSTVTLVYCDKQTAANDADDDDGNDGTTTTTTKNASSSSSSGKNNNNMRQLEPLSKRILAWCYPFDPNNPSEPDPPGGGFPLPERIPIASLFRDRGAA